MPRFGGEKALTKHALHDEALKNTLMIEDVKVEVVPKMIDNSMVIGTSHVVRKPKTKMKVGMAKSEMAPEITSSLEKATHNLYDLEEAHTPEKTLNIDLNLYQMEEY